MIMDTFHITGGKPLEGEIELSGAKNGASKMMIASLLTNEPVILDNVPRQRETQITQEILESLGARVEWLEANTVRIQARDIDASSLENISQKNRIAVLALSPLLHRVGSAHVPSPGGDRIGPRPVDFHLSTLRNMGAVIETSQDGYHASAKKKLRGALIELPYPSVGATETALLAGVLAEGRTTVRNAAMEPEVQELVMLLQKMGAIVQINAGRSMEIYGVEKLGGATMRVMSDRIEAASYACMALGTRGRVFVRGAEHHRMITFLNTVRRLGGSYRVDDDGILFMGASSYHGIELETDTHPGFMTDWQQPFVVVLTQTNGTSVVHETVYEERFGYTRALIDMGADISLFSNCLGEAPCRFRGQNYRHSAVINGPTSLHAANVEVPDIRAGLAFVVGALVADGTSILSGIEHLDRGYERLEEKLKGVGAKVERRR
jgi:UDP-N-acetylglucosamine 1-carboxyvinyltransferase